jgi:hypothetical protein
MGVYQAGHDQLAPAVNGFGSLYSRKPGGGRNAHDTAVFYRNAEMFGGFKIRR